MEDEDRIINSTMNNVYLLLIGKKTMEEIIKDGSYFIHNPFNECSTGVDMYNALIKHYEYTEDYERCAKLRDIKNAMLITNKKNKGSVAINK